MLGSFIYFSRKRALFDVHRYFVKVIMTHRHDISKKCDIVLIILD